MKNAVFIHGYNGIPKIYHWLKEQLETKGYKIIMPEFPAQKGVIYDNWSKILDSNKEQFNSKTIVIAHSIGNEFIVKYLAKNKIKIDLYISLAGFSQYFEKDDKPDLTRAVKEFLVSKEEIQEFKRLVRKKYSIYSDNDHIVPFDILERYPRTMDCESILIKGIGHMGKKSGLESIPEVIGIIEKEESNYFIIHGSFGNPYVNWIPWLQDFITSDGKEVYVPDFPTGVGFQNYTNWSVLLKYYLDLGLINENTIIIGHSIAPVFICKFLIKNKVKVKKLIFVCGFNNYLGINEEYDTVNKSMYLDNLENIKQYSKDIVCFYSDNDPYVKQEAEKNFADKVATEQVFISNGGHLNSESGYDTFEEIVGYL